MSSFVPRYYEIEQALRGRVARLEPHSPLPSEAQLCTEFGVSRMTARAAVQRLVQDGLVYRVPGRGTFVAASRANRTAGHILSFSDEMRRKGRVPSSRIIERRRRRATEDEARRLGVRDVVVLRRVRLADGKPLALERAVFPASSRRSMPTSSASRCSRLWRRRDWCRRAAARRWQRRPRRPKTPASCV
jgi:GntR family transcriptional regulator